MDILHISAECFPMAKAGGLADVVGALPKYQNALTHNAKVIMPMHRTNFLLKNEWDVVHKDDFQSGNLNISFTVIKLIQLDLGFELYCIDINGILDREKIYGYDDDSLRFILFQMAAIEWIQKWTNHPDIIHVHDYHTGLIPFFLKHCFRYKKLSHIKTVLTIHNAQYQGWMHSSFTNYFPEWDSWKAGLLYWNDQINPLACAIKCVDKVTTVSPTYMKEIIYQANGLEQLFVNEINKCSGILNGIDYKVWNPITDTLILKNFDEHSFENGKLANKQHLCKMFGFDEALPLFVFIGRLVGEKAADLLPDAINYAFDKYENQFNVLILGNGETAIENRFSDMHQRWFGYFHSQIEFNEQLSHQMYAGADFLIMPSRVEPCGLNQMYALHYGTMPIVRRTGGLNDTVIDLGDKNGFGICFNNASVDDIVDSMGRAIHVFANKPLVHQLRKKMMTINNSWEKSAKDYIELYQSI
jgi:starch synthase